jgi:hypothetical protein
MDDLNGWQRLWVMTKGGAGIAAGIYSGNKIGEVAMRDPKLADSGMSVLMAALIAGFLVYGAFSALEWVYRGFRPLATTPTEAAPAPLAEASEDGTESPLALAHQAIQQSPLESPAPSKEPQQREFYP